MKIQLTLNNPESIKVYKLLENKMKSKAIEHALVLLLKENDMGELFFGHKNYKKALSTISVKTEQIKDEEKKDDENKINKDKESVEVTDWEQK